MSKEKQIEDFENDLRECHTEFSVSDDSMDLYTDYKITAQNMIGKGWRKQSEGEWVLIEQEDFIYKLCKCSVCGAESFFEADDELCSYCPNCGAKMKGGGEE